MKTILIAGLGNPGSEYDETRHNVGFMALDAIAHSFKVRRFNHNRLAHWAAADLALCDGPEPVRLVLVKPQTFMNASGVAIAPMMKERNILLENLIVIHDEMDLPIGAIRISFNATAAGHKGVRSIAENCGGKGFVRVRLGIGKPDSADGVIDHVLSRFSRSEQSSVIDAIAKTPTVIRTIICNGLMAAQDMYNRKVAKD
ncbi:MAG TPA: aminoacyl-tRNA hydrolase [Clostridia bacterium]|nr:aminoacyl-tRNA hydrolase [Clostridia bacterium]